jgi:hypothetical protein
VRRNLLSQLLDLLLVLVAAADVVHFAVALLEKI